MLQVAQTKEYHGDIANTQSGKEETAKQNSVKLNKKYGSDMGFFYFNIGTNFSRIIKKKGTRQGALPLASFLAPLSSSDFSSFEVKFNSSKTRILRYNLLEVSNAP